TLVSAHDERGAKKLPLGKVTTRATRPRGGACAGPRVAGLSRPEWGVRRSEGGSARLEPKRHQRETHASHAWLGARSKPRRNPRSRRGVERAVLLRRQGPQPGGPGPFTPGRLADAARGGRRGLPVHP